jgi:hypothetical protein
LQPERGWPARDGETRGSEVEGLVIWLGACVAAVLIIGTVFWLGWDRV